MKFLLNMYLLESASLLEHFLHAVGCFAFFFGVANVNSLFSTK